MRDKRPLLVRYGPPLAADDPALPATAPPTATFENATTAPLSRWAVGTRWKPLAVQATGVWVASRLLLFIFTLATALLDGVRGTGVSSPLDLLELWRRFDVTAYLHIVEWGYTTTAQAAFFPLYPLLISGATHIFGADHDLLLAMLISNLGTLIAFLGVGKLALDEGGSEGAARNSMLALAAYPMAFFLGAAYTEGPFLAAAVWCLWGMRRGHWPIAAGCAFIAALLRPTGLILVAPLLYEFARQHAWGREIVLLLRGRRQGETLRRLRTIGAQGALTLLAGPAGVAIFSLYCSLQYGDALAWLHAEATSWGRPGMPIWQSLHDTTAYMLSLRPLSLTQDKKLVDYIAIFTVLALTAALARRQPVSFTLYLAGMLYLTLASPFVISASQHYAVFLSASRYMLPAIPLYLAIGRWSLGSPWLARVAFVGCLALQAVFAVYFLHGGWVA
jgi:hypothetical protein